MYNIVYGNMKGYNFKYKKYDNNAPYSKRSATEVRNDCKRRRIDYHGKKAELMARLQQHDYDHPFKFLSLPLEIRTQIYKYVTDNWASGIDGAGEKKRMRQPGLFQVCRLIRQEGHGLFFQHGQFEIRVRSQHIATIFSLPTLRSLGRRGLKSIRHLSVEMWLNDNCKRIVKEINLHVSQQAVIVYQWLEDLDWDDVPEDMKGFYQSLGTKRNATVTFSSTDTHRCITYTPRASSPAE